MERRGGLLKFCRRSSPLGHCGGGCGGQRGENILLRFCTHSSPLGFGGGCGGQRGGDKILLDGANSFCIQLHHQLPICVTGLAVHCV